MCARIGGGRGGVERKRESAREQEQNIKREGSRRRESRRRGAARAEVLEGHPLAARFLGSHPLATKAPGSPELAGWGGVGCGRKRGGVLVGRRGGRGGVKRGEGPIHKIRHPLTPSPHLHPMAAA